MAPEKAEGDIISIEEYGRIYAAVRETVRGRWFLDEYAKRNRHAETQVILEALRRLEGSVAARPETRDGRRIMMHLAGLSDAVSIMREDIAVLEIPPRLRLAVQMVERHAAAVTALVSEDEPASATSACMPDDRFAFGDFDVA